LKRCPWSDGPKGHRPSDWIPSAVWTNWPTSSATTPPPGEVPSTWTSTKPFSPRRSLKTPAPIISIIADG